MEFGLRQLHGIRQLGLPVVGHRWNPIASRKFHKVRDQSGSVAMVSVSKRHVRRWRGASLHSAHHIFHGAHRPLPADREGSVVGYHSSWARNGVPHRKPHRDGTDADGGHPREGFRIQSVRCYVRVHAVRRTLPQAVVVRAGEHVVSSEQSKKGNEPGEDATTISVLQ